MSELMRHIVIVVVPLLASNILHMAVVKLNGLKLLAVPIWRAGFGQNKTWRGFVITPLLNATFLYALDQWCGINLEHAFLIGFLLGLAYMVLELPNSYFKRSQGISAGERPAKHRLFFTLLDKTDSVIGVLLTYYFLSDIDLNSTLLLFVLGTATHFLVSYLLVILKIKKSL